MTLPRFITFTGVDERTDISRLQRIDRKYPGKIEWAILRSKTKNGQVHRYPSELVADNFQHIPVAKAMHVCGAWSRQINNHPDGAWPVDLNPHYFNRVQVNHTHPDPIRLVTLSERYGRQFIGQCRDYFPRPSMGVRWLFDASGGRGIKPSVWIDPSHQSISCGYAGGIDPDSARSVVAKIPAATYWIDMETGVRTDDWFDLDKCEAVLKAVYGNQP